jgi:hypothetical protein
MPQQLSDADYYRLLSNAQKGQFSQEVWDRADQMKIGNELREIIKKTHPGVPHPGYDEEKRVNERIDKLEKDRADREKKAADDAEDKRWNDELKSVKERHKYSDDEMKKLDKYMRDHKIYEPEAAALYMNRKEPRMTGPDDSDGRFMNYQKQSDWDDIAKEPAKWLEKQIYGVYKQQEDASRNGRF